MFDLPTHLPNELPTHLPNQPTHTEPVQEPTEDILDEEQQAKPNPNEPIYIPGTNITLQTEEDIAKWIEERKKKWPSKQVVAKKLEQKQSEIQQKEDRKRPAESKEAPGKRTKAVCRFYQQNKKCKFGNKCKNLHVIEANPLAGHELTHYKRTVNGIPVLIPKLYSNRTHNTPSKSSLFKHLISRDQSVENDQIIEFIKFLDKQGLIDHNVHI
ncbi:uncharacterized protein SPAPADRAFT_154739 [Spathaspora passalidarum NRRL Y-27907]|uniref:C3H1-type domain-containing protein n=1 Tax=Spathaspora passalidarum (strain NRRL Y-27907 / 11-Y1) TaxID=619300 RepID=G3AQF3_SPAPN|nr:uncharacterized protein SPAPADRAFT_154739 [Spathaspora passalidarum NRRL Y-27907]EGW31499.1 hypothetical protein SPAPADRAFT_154739 [Spathaspora passalidarum NRRL Y-27907]